MNLNKLKTLISDTKVSQKRLHDYIASTNFSNVEIPLEDFKDIVDSFPVGIWIDDEFTKKLNEMIGVDIWDFGYSKHESVIFFEVIERILELDDEDQINCLLKWASTCSIEEAINKAVNAIQKHALETKSSGFELDW